MLSHEAQIHVEGYTLFQDLQDKSLYYYLPSESVRIANDAKSLHYVDFIDGTAKSGEDGSERRIGGSLALETELGPDEDELETIRKSLAAQTGKSDLKLAPVPFKTGEVSLMMFGHEGKEDVSEDESTKVKIKVVGTGKPSMIGNQKAAFSALLGPEEAQILWDLFHNTPQTQICVKYDMQFQGVMPAYYVEIQVDFSETEKYWDHHFTTKLNANYTDKVTEGKNTDDLSLVVAADVDVDVMLRDLINQGAITIKSIDYSGNPSDNPLPGDDPTGMGLVKQLLSSELFTVTPLPSTDYSALNLKDLAQQKPDATSGSGNKPEGGEQNKPATEVKQQTPSRTGEKKDENADKQKATETGEKKDGEKNDLGQAQKPKTNEMRADAVSTSSSKATDINAPSDKTSPDNKPSEEKKTTDSTSTKKTTDLTFDQVDTDHNKLIAFKEWYDAGLPIDEFIKYAIYSEEEKKAAITEEGFKRFKTQGQVPVPDPVPDPNKTIEKAEPAKVESIQFKADLKVGYTYKRRDIKEQKKRSYIFNKQQAQLFSYCPQGILSTENTSFDPDKQVTLVHLWEGQFSSNKLVFTTAVDFDKMNLQEIAIDVDIPYDDLNKKVITWTQADPIRLNKTKTSASIDINSAPFHERRVGFNYTVKYIFNGDATFVGFEEKPVCVKKFENVFDATISLDMSVFPELLPRQIEAGSIQFTKEAGIEYVKVRVLDANDATLDTTTLRNGFDPITILFNANKQYKTQLEYQLSGVGNKAEIGGIQCSNNLLKFIDDESDRDDIIVEMPRKGLILVRTPRGEATFQKGINWITVIIEQGEKEYTLYLSEDRPEAYFVVNPDIDEEILVKSVLIDREGQDEEEVFQPSKKILSPTDPELMLKIK